MLDRTGEEIHVSASQVKAFEACPRKWAFDKIDKMPRSDPSKFAAMGSQGHKLIEDYLKGLIREIPQDTQIGRAAALIVSTLRLPPKHPAVQVEAYYDIRFDCWQSGDKEIKFLGFLDIFADLTPKGKNPVISDHKFTTNLSYKIEPEALVQDVAATIYALWAMIKTGSQSVDLKWTYCKWNQDNPRVSPSNTTVTLPDILPRVQETIGTARKIMQCHKTIKNAHELAPNVGACGDFGGCEMAAHCGLTQAQVIERDALLGRKKSK